MACCPSNASDATTQPDQHAATTPAANTPTPAFTDPQAFSTSRKHAGHSDAGIAPHLTCSNRPILLNPPNTA